MTTNERRRALLAEPLAVRVARGAKLLDAFVPDWSMLVALDQLAMESCDQCVLGQLCGSYMDGCWILIGLLPGTFLFSAAHHGFTVHEEEQWCSRDQPYEEVIARFHQLADCWRAEIETRVKARGPQPQDPGGEPVR